MEGPEKASRPCPACGKHDEALTQIDEDVYLCSDCFNMYLLKRRQIKISKRRKREELQHYDTL